MYHKIIIFNRIGWFKISLLFKEIWHDISPSSLKTSEHVGKDLKYDTENLVEYVYIKNLHDLLTQLIYIAAEKLYCWTQEIIIFTLKNFIFNNFFK